MTPAEQRQRAYDLSGRVSEFAHQLTRAGHCPALTDDLRLAASHLSYAAGNTRKDFRTARLKQAETCFAIIRQRIEGTPQNDAV